MILDTIKHKTQESSTSQTYLNLSRYFLDADLSILGADSDIYADYADKIWQEYSFFTRKPYCEKRPTVLKKLIADPETLYQTVEFREKFADKAVNNVEAEILQL